MKSTNDVWFASYLKLSGHELVNFEILHRHRGKYYFDITDTEWKKLKIEFDRSNICKVKMIQVSLMDLLH